MRTLQPVRGETTTEERPDVNHPCGNAAGITRKGYGCDCVRRHAPLPGKTKGKPKTKKRFAVEVGGQKDDLGNGLSALGPDEEDEDKVGPPQKALNYEFGSGCWFAGVEHPEKKPRRYAHHTMHCDMTDLLFYADLLPTQAGQIDVVELCGGMGGVLKSSITRGLTTGEKSTCVQTGTS